jgi:hypothetical protein
MMPLTFFSSSLPLLHDRWRSVVIGARSWLADDEQRSAILAMLAAAGGLR